MNSLGKILEKAVSFQLVNHLESKGILSDSQYAYRKNRSTELAAVRLVKRLLENFDENKVTIAVFLDLTRAFDCVDHSILGKKLEHYGIKNIPLQWFMSYLTDRKQYVKINGVNSATQNIKIGVPQGSILGPLLFLIYINDLSEILDSGDNILFADDATHLDWGDDFYIVKNRMNQSLNIISQWFLANKLSVNVIKSEAMVFTRKNLYFPLPPLLLLNNPLPYNFSFKFLGLHIDFKLNWRIHVQRIRTKLSSACGILFQIRNKISRYVAKIIYLSLCLPYLQYCNILWASGSASNLTPIFNCQKKIIRIILKKGRREPSTPLFKKLKLLKLCDVNNLNSAQFVYKSIHELIPSPISFVQQAPGPYNLRHREVLYVPFTRSKQSQRFILVRGAKLWNDLPLEMRTCRTINSFKKRLKRYYLDQYN